ncbi:hypothetical protein BJX68DRAFT_270370 [Aspergillus pseudodeflectus]|uniref:GPR1/FUN34/yaaH family-domain-containing protein n=1 Tax=Aspergillus pseudodeflectus TaxID=176178 RepID=A0ABR4JSN5_9EURO
MKQETEQVERQFSAEVRPQQASLKPAIANPLPLGLLSFATGLFLVCVLDLNARSITTPNIVVGVLIFFGGFAAFNFSYAMIFLPGTGIMAAYTDAETGELRAEFHQALAMYLIAWFILTVIFTIRQSGRPGFCLRTSSSWIFAFSSWPVVIWRAARGFSKPGTRWAWL